MSERLKAVQLFAWLGEDEFSSGEVGIKRALVPAGDIPIVATSIKVGRQDIQDQLNEQAKKYGKKIYLCRFMFEEVIAETEGGEPLR